MLHASTQKLIVKLCELTALGDIQWREAPGGAVKLETEGYIVEAEGQPAKVRVLTVDGAELEHADAVQLGAAWPDGEGSFADHVSAMVVQALRLARGTDHAISRILSSLSAPPAVVSEIRDDAPLRIGDGLESEATMAAAVGDMAARLHRTPLEPADELRASPPVDPKPVQPEAIGMQPKAEEFETPTPAMPDPAPRAAHHEHVKRSTEIFGRTRSFAVAGRTHHRPWTEARPVASLGKSSANGPAATGATSGNGRQTESGPFHGEVDPAPQPEETPSRPPRTPMPASPDAYKPWV